VDSDTSNKAGTSRYQFSIKDKDAASTTLSLRIFDEKLRGSHKHFFRLDFYPEVNPIHLERHYGFWDIPAKYIVEEEMLFQVEYGILFLLSGPYRQPLDPSFRSSFNESGVCAVHASLFCHGDTTVQEETKFLNFSWKSDDKGITLRKLVIPVTEKCNLNCTMCPRQASKSISKLDVSGEVLEPCYEILPEVYSSIVATYGEPFLNSEMVNIIKKTKSLMPKGSEVVTISNGTLLSNKLASQVIDSGLDSLYISMDGASEDTVKKIRRGASFAAVKDNVEGLTSLRNDRGLKTPRVMMNFVLMESNLNEVEEYIRVFGKLNVDSISLSHLYDSTTETFQTLTDQGLENIFENARRIARDFDVSLITPPLRRSSNRRCLFTQQAIVMISGDVYPCCRLQPGYTSKSFKPFGNVKHNSLRVIWGSARFTEFRQRLENGIFEGACADCDYSYGLV
jgi:radical SAM protein with 4Fe4S-binding SPASM domain